MSELALLEELRPARPVHALADDAPGAMQLLLDLEVAGAATPRALVLPADLDYDSYESLGGFLGEVKSRINFYLGDWLIDGEGRFGERWAQACEATGLAEVTLLRVMAVCRNVPARRRRDALSFSVHAAVMSLGARQQVTWLSRAEENGWGYAELRNAMKAAEAEERPPMFDEEGEVGSGPNVELLIEVTRDIVRNAEVAGENVIIRREDFSRLRAALGEEEA